MTRTATVLAVEIGADDRTLTVSVAHGSCEALTPEATEAADEVVVRVGSRSTIGPGEFCDLAGHVSPFTVELVEPLGDRHLVVEEPGQPLDFGRGPLCVHRAGDRWCRPGTERRHGQDVPTADPDLTPTVAIPVEHAAGRTTFTATLSDGRRFRVEVPGEYDEILQVEHRRVAYDQARHWGGVWVHNLSFGTPAATTVEGWAVDPVVYVHPDVEDPDAHRAALVAAVEVSPPTEPGAAPRVTAPPDVLDATAIETYWILDRGLGLYLLEDGSFEVGAHYVGSLYPELERLRPVRLPVEGEVDAEAEAVRPGVVVTPLG